MPSKPDGGPAFPGGVTDERYAEDVMPGEPVNLGMTLRCYVASEQMAGLISSSVLMPGLISQAAEEDANVFELAVDTACYMADRLLAKLNKEGEPDETDP